MIFKFVLGLTVLVAVLGTMTEGREIHRRDTDNLVSVDELALDAVKHEVKRSENLKSSGQEASHSIASAIMKSIENVKEKAIKAAKPVQKRSLEQKQEDSSTLSSCCG